MEIRDSREEGKKKPGSREQLKRYLVCALLLVTAAILIYVFVWFGAQLGLQN